MGYLPVTPVPGCQYRAAANSYRFYRYYICFSLLLSSSVLAVCDIFCSLKDCIAQRALKRRFWKPE